DIPGRPDSPLRDPDTRDNPRADHPEPDIPQASARRDMAGTRPPAGTRPADDRAADRRASRRAPAFPGTDTALGPRESGPPGPRSGRPRARIRPGTRSDSPTRSRTLVAPADPGPHKPRGTPTSAAATATLRPARRA